MLYIRTINSTRENCPEYIYISKMWKSGKETPIHQVIDTATYQQLGNSNYSKDKNHVYFLRETPDTGHFIILHNASSENFKLIRQKGVLFGNSSGIWYHNGNEMDSNELL